jgi:hypothetical protein
MISALTLAGGAPAEQLPDNCRGWIPTSCCCSNSCCFEIGAADVTELGNGKWRIEATGEEIAAKLSRDGAWVRCACSYSQILGKWLPADAFGTTHCLFIPLLG